jgi:hypothetical protein
VLSIKQFLDPEWIAELEHPTYSPDLAQNDFWLFPKIKSTLKVWRFHNHKDIQWQWHLKLFHNRSSCF